MNYQEIQDKIDKIDWSLDHGIATDLMTKLIESHGDEKCETNCTCDYCSLVKKYKNLNKKNKKINNLLWHCNSDDRLDFFKDCFYSIDYYEEVCENMCFMMKEVEKQQIDMKEKAIENIKG